MPASTLTVLAAAALLAAVPEEALPERFKNWLDHDVLAIIAVPERKVFLELPDDEARDRFIEAFWLARDPTPGTRKNELREEHERRVAHADQQYGPEGTHTGSGTDRGRAYVLLGEPRDRREFSSLPGGLYPCELWSYPAPKDVGLPPSFCLLFFKPKGVGEYRLYSPLLDGPSALIGGGPFVVPSEELALNVLKTVDRELYGASISLDPGGADAPAPAIASEVLLSKIANLPSVMADTHYLRRFRPAPAEGEVPAAASYAGFDLEPLVFATLEPDDVGWLSYEVVVPPSYLGLVEHGAGFAASLELFVTVSDQAGRTVRQLIEPLELKLDRQQAAAAATVPLAIEGRAALIPGTYALRFLLRNRATGQFGTAETRLTVPGAGLGSARPELLGSFLAFHAEPAPPPGAPLRPPFEVRAMRTFPARQASFGKDDRPWLVAALRYPKGMGPPPRLVKTLTVTRDGAEVFGHMAYLEPNPALDAGVIGIVEEVRLGDAAPGDYEVTIRIGAREGEAGVEARQRLRVVDGPVARPWAFVREAPAAVHRELARQYQVRGETRRAIDEIQAMLAEEKGPGARLDAAAALLKLGEAERAEQALKPLLASPRAPVLARVYAGASLEQQHRYAEAAAHYQKAVAESDGSTALLNALGRALAKAGNAPEARKALERSLALDPAQPDVKQLVESLPPAK